MTSHVMHTGVFSNKIRNAEQFQSSWRRAAERTLKIIAKDLNHVRFDIGYRVMGVEGVTLDNLEQLHVAEELQQLLALAQALGKDEFVVRDICPACPTGREGADTVTRAAERISEELLEAQAAGSNAAANIRVSLRDGKFDLRVYLSGSGPTKFETTDAAEVFSR